MVVPDVFQEHRSRHHLPRMLHQIFQQPELARLQRQFVLAAHHPMRKTVEFEIADAIGGLLGGAAAAARQHFDPREQLGE